MGNFAGRDNSEGWYNAALGNAAGYYNTTGFAFSGSIDDVQIYDEALSASDATFLLNNAGTAVGVPEPSSTALLGLGGLALILRRRK